MAAVTARIRAEEGIVRFSIGETAVVLRSQSKTDTGLDSQELGQPRLDAHRGGIPAMQIWLHAETPDAYATVSYFG